MIRDELFWIMKRIDITTESYHKGRNSIFNDLLACYILCLLASDTLLLCLECMLLWRITSSLDFCIDEYMIHQLLFDFWFLRRDVICSCDLMFLLIVVSRRWFCYGTEAQLKYDVGRLLEIDTLVANQRVDSLKFLASKKIQAFGIADIYIDTHTLSKVTNIFRLVLFSYVWGTHVHCHFVQAGRNVLYLDEFLLLSYDFHFYPFHVLQM